MGRGFTLIDADNSKTSLLSRIVECFSAEFRLRSEVQDKANLELRGFKVIKKLSFMFDDNGLGSLNFYNDGILNEYVGKVISDDRVFIINLNWMLSNYIQV